MIYPFEAAKQDLEWMPLAVRRALDRAGRKLSLRAWQSMPLEKRERLVCLGSEVQVNVPGLLQTMVNVRPVAAEIPRVAEPAAAIDEQTQRLLPKALQKSWAQLHPLERFVVLHYAERGKHEALAAACDFFCCAPGLT